MPALGRTKPHLVILPASNPPTQVNEGNGLDKHEDVTILSESFVNLWLNVMYYDYDMSDIYMSVLLYNSQRGQIIVNRATGGALDGRETDWTIQ